MTVDVASEVTGAVTTRRLQTAYFAPLAAVCSEDLYLAVDAGLALRRRERVELEPYTRVSSRTYFGRFPAAHYQRWTTVSSVDVEVTVSGKGRVQVFASDSQDLERLVASAEFDSSEDVDLSFPVAIDKFLDGGFLWVETESYDASAAMWPIRYSTSSKVSETVASVVVCTFNRAPECLATLEALTTVAGAPGQIRDVFVVDQGTDLVENQPGFPAVTQKLGSALHYVRQPNLGGAGGFTRGLYESMGMTSRPDYVIFMDDDIVLEPETANRMVAFADHSIEPLLVGGQMLYLYHPNMLHTSAEYARLDQLKAGIPAHEDEAGLDLTEELPVEWVDAQYNAWWACLIPTKVVETIGYPLPVFFQWDDIEFGIRAGERGIPTVTLPGAAVWHADFSMKDGDDWARYFSHRNSLIVAALHSDLVPKVVTKTLFKEVLRFILSMQYARAAMQLSAVDAFLTGPSHLEDGGAEIAAWVRKMRADYPDTIRHSPADIAKRNLHGVPKHRDRGTPSQPAAVFLKRVVHQVLGMNRVTAKISAADNIWWHVSLFKSVIVTDAAQDAFRIRSLDPQLSWKTARRALRTLARLRLHGAAATEQWRQAFPELTSRENWARLYGHSD
ncbi:glycosyltransferase [Naasia sp. SYSU D00948]|uniref:glycosyltransferase n=1 Tax=Naasia sp. SYSU D00948 TaxID=2817379 RepID=UPI001B301E9E|nr:glycosyltransferase [Naasia sp. SYSU D00948]